MNKRDRWATIAVVLAMVSLVAALFCFSIHFLSETPQYPHIGPLPTGR